MGDEQKNEVEKQKLDRKFQLVFCVFFIVLALFMLSLTVEMEILHPQRVLGPGAFPLGLLVIIIGLFVWLAIQVITGKGSSAKLKNHIDISSSKKAFFLLGRIFITVVLMQFIGFVIALMLFTFVELRFFSKKKLKWLSILLCTFILPVVIFLIFDFLHIGLPTLIWF